MQRVARLALSGRPDDVPDEGRDGRLSRAVRGAIRSPRSNRHQCGRSLARGRSDRRDVGHRRFEADNVVVATGAHRIPKIPPFARELDPSIVQLHSSEYRNPSQLRDGGVLLAGAGNSGAEIANECAARTRAGSRAPTRDTSPFATGRPKPGSSSPWCASSVTTC
ncbi:MAG TPA: SidA/IucD/PvdA family monooxygenase [Actinomycetota bacterium]|nr:SidA/IucD/PvdA family monooxygenase [Actinomycetota bacterium]